MTDIEKTVPNDRQSSDAAVTAIIGTAVAPATAMTVPAATAVVLGPAASTIAATAVADNGRCWTTAVAAITVVAARPLLRWRLAAFDVPLLCKFLAR